MLRILGHNRRVCDGLSRRELMRVTALSLAGGLVLPGSTFAEPMSSLRRTGTARSVVLLNLFGGPSHLDMFDMKPAAPAEVRGEFRPIATSTPGVHICQHLPRTARIMDRVALIRTLTHRYNSHNPYAVLTGFTHGEDRENYFAKPSDHPGMGAVCQHFGLGRRDVPSYVIMPAFPGYSQGLRRAGPYGGYLGNQFNPLFSTCEPRFDLPADPDRTAYEPITPWGEPQFPSLGMAAELTLDRLDRRRTLLEQLDARLTRLDASRAINQMSHSQRQGLDLLTSSQMRRAFDLSREPLAVRQRYGEDLYGSSVLMARRLVEAGSTFIVVNTESRGGGHWDTHEKNFSMLRDYLLPLLDRVFSTLVEDLADRGLLDSTLVAVMGDMGRTPKINAKAGRDHWPQCGFCVLAGGGTRAGLVFGETDKQGAYPRNNPVSPGDICATIYHLLGLDPAATVPDQVGRPIGIAHGGEPIRGVIA